MLEALLDAEADDDDDDAAVDLSPEELKQRLDSGDMVLLTDNDLGDDAVPEDIGEIGGGADVSHLISKDGVMSKRFREILEEIFERFADPAHKEARLWSESALDAFHRAVNGTPISPCTFPLFFPNSFPFHRLGKLVG